MVTIKLGSSHLKAIENIRQMVWGPAIPEEKIPSLRDTITNSFIARAVLGLALCQPELLTKWIKAHYKYLEDEGFATTTKYNDDGWFVRSFPNEHFFGVLNARMNTAGSKSKRVRVDIKA